MFCEKCGAQLNSNERFCYRCGAKIPGQAENIQAVRKPKRIGLIILGVSLLVFVLAGMILLFLVFGNKGKRYEDQIALAERYLNELEYDKAIEAYKEAISIDPERSEAYIGLAKLYEETGDYEAAVDILEEGYEETEDRTVKRKLEKARNTVAKADTEKEVTPTAAPIPTSAPKSTPTPTEAEEEPYEEDDPTEGDPSSDEFALASAKLDATAKKKYREAIEKELEGGESYEYSFYFIYLDEDDIPEIAMFYIWTASVFWYDGDTVEIACGSPVSSLYYIPYTGRIHYEENAAECIDKTIIVNKNGKDTIPGSGRNGDGMRGDKVFEAIASGENYTVNGKKVSCDEWVRQINLERWDMIHLRADEAQAYIDQSFSGKTLSKEEFLRYLE